MKRSEFIDADLLAEVDHPWSLVRSPGAEAANTVNHSRLRAPIQIVLAIVIAVSAVLLMGRALDQSATASSHPVPVDLKQRLATPPPAPALAPTDGPERAKLPRERLYHEAARFYGVDWRLVAAIGMLESDHGRSDAPGVHSGVNFAGCCAGPAQFNVSPEANTWAAYGVDADGDGEANPYSLTDAFFSAARNLAALEDQLGSDPRLLLAAYNAGPGNVADYGGVPPFPDTQDYVARGGELIASLDR